MAEKEKKITDEGKKLIRTCILDGIPTLQQAKADLDGFVGALASWSQVFGMDDSGLRVFKHMRFTYATRGDVGSRTIVVELKPRPARFLRNVVSLEIKMGDAGLFKVKGSIRAKSPNAPVQSVTVYGDAFNEGFHITSASIGNGESMVSFSTGASIGFYHVSSTLMAAKSAAEPEMTVPRNLKTEGEVVAMLQEATCAMTA